MNVEIDMINRKTENTISKLRSKRKKMIASLKYEEAQKIDDEIVVHHQNAIEDSIQIIISEFEEVVNSYLQRIYDSDQYIDKECNELINEHQKKYHYNFKNIQQEHLQALALIESRYQDSRMRENERRYPEQTHLLELSKKAALNGDYQQALELRDKSRIVAQESLENRLNQLEMDFNSQREEKINEFKTIFEQMVARYNGGFDVHRKAAEKKHEAFKTNRDLQLTSFYQKATTKLNSIFKSSSVIQQADLQLRAILKSQCESFNYIPPSITAVLPAEKSTLKSNTVSRTSTRSSSRLPSRTTTKRTY
ncbi:hypothetical protein TRFO_23768 [Tritrichomonas foetus]|uniref:Uncharacterized protein n=1 Tax=Tritrichomonas foetus TaxID=1144522 RepID=A0A1J4KEK8_9EUKA|nr:hypothetical protein TRFO_23768 [Tritrichomonas foetus]|eukprot:OHT07829.1 hypothetical protein TRFO_23768 [Tritrichomonas foetus]